MVAAIGRHHDHIRAGTLARMWQENVTALARAATGNTDLVAVRVPDGRPGDWACVPLGSAKLPEAALEGLRGQEQVATVHRDGQRWVLTLTDRARGQVVAELLGSGARVPLRQLPADIELPSDRLYAARLAHARTWMLTRAAHAHAIAPPGAEPALARIWSTANLGPVSGASDRRLLLALAGSRLARRRADDQGRSAPIVASLRDITAAFEQWFTRVRLTPRGTAGSTGASEGAMMEAYGLRLGLATAVGSALRAGLTDLGLDSPEHL